MALTAHNTYQRKQAPILASDFLARTRHLETHSPDCIREHNAATYCCSPYSALDPEAAIANCMAGTAVGGLTAWAPEDGFLDSLLGETKLSFITGRVSNMQNRANGASGTVKANARTDVSADSLAKAQGLLGEMNEELRVQASLAAARQARGTIEGMIEQFYARLDAENQGMSDWERELVLTKGYAEADGTYRRQAIVDSTVGGNAEYVKIVYASFIGGLHQAAFDRGR